MNSRSIIWIGRPWIIPGVAARSALMVIVAAAVFWLEFWFDVATYTPILNVPLILWTGVAVLLAWLASLTNLLLLRASNTYVLRNDSLEIKSGILTSRSFAVSPSGFSDLEVIRSISARIVNSGDIIIRTQSENMSDIKMGRVRNPMKVADKIREVMARPVVRLDK